MSKLDSLLEELDDLEPQEKLEWLIEFADQLPALSDGLADLPFPDSCRVQECQTPVHLWVSIHEGKVQIEAAIPEKSPIVRGLVAMFVVGLNGQTVSDALEIPDDPAAQWKLSEALGMTRQQGMRGVAARIKRCLRNSAGNG
ncbi:MAG: SufE family protein [Planctomycetes bacterium]|nr:SufE family protein [Planctomycetota bacterium]